jgi:hypothetical protein
MPEPILQTEQQEGDNILPMNDRSNPVSSLCGQSFRDRDGQRWWVKAPRPGPEHQLIVESELKGSYPRIAQYVMTEREFREHARNADLRPEKSPARRSSHR